MTTSISTTALLADRDVMAAARALRPDDDPAHTAAHAAWSVLAEPGDAVASALIDAMGVVDALDTALSDTLLRTPLETVGARAMNEAVGRWRPRADLRAMTAAMRDARDVAARMVVPGDPEWPEQLAALGLHAPSMLWVRGDARALANASTVAVVGARASTGYGESIAAEIAGDLAADGTLIVSGGAYGIDGVAHRAALGVDGQTVAFLAGGVDRAYPAGHQQLFERIRRGGAVVSEVPCGTAPTRWRFLARNRLIAAAGRATVVIEAGWRSGTLNTAGHAATLGRPIGAVPGPVTSAASAGCHRLLREYDAVCVTTAAEVRELWGEAEVARTDTPKAHPDETRLLDAMSTRSPRALGDLAARSGLSLDRVRALLGALDLDGRVAGSGAGWRRTA